MDVGRKTATQNFPNQFVCGQPYLVLTMTSCVHLFVLAVWSVSGENNWPEIPRWVWCEWLILVWFTSLSTGCVTVDRKGYTQGLLETEHRQFWRIVPWTLTHGVASNLGCRLCQVIVNSSGHLDVVSCTQSPERKRWTVQWPRCTWGPPHTKRFQCFGHQRHQRWVCTACWFHFLAMDTGDATLAFPPPTHLEVDACCEW